MKKLSVCVLFGGISPEHEVSLRSAESVLNNMDPEKYNIFPVGITKEGDWILFGGDDYSMLPAGNWKDCPQNRRAAISPVRGQGLLSFEGDCVVREHIDVVFPVLHGENGEDGAMQGLLQLAGIPYVGPHISASAVAMDKTLTKLVVDNAKITQAAWQLVRNSELDRNMDNVLSNLEQKFRYPMFVKPAGTGSSVGVSKASDREELRTALLCGIVLAAACFVKIWLIDRLALNNPDITFMVTAVVCLTLAVTVVCAKLVGCLLPMAAKALKLDPAVMASPFISTIIDALSLLVYFLFAQWLLGL
jgi:D-alanine--D-alanine ligase